MTEVASAYVTLLPSTRGFGRKLDGQLSGDVNRSGQTAGKRFGGAFTSASMSPIRKLGGAVAAVGFVALGASGLTAGLKTAAGMENARIAFTTMLGSAQKADLFLRDLGKFAAKTPFEFPELQTAASSLISAGIEAKNVIPIMTSLGNATSGMGTGSEGVKRATVALQQMNAAGRITGEDLNQLRDAGIPVYDLLAKATGKSKEEVAKLAQTGKLGKKELQQMMDALASGKGLERFNGLMDKQSASLSGMFSTLKDTVNMTLANMVAPALPAIKGAMGNISAGIQTAAPKIVSGLGVAVGYVREHFVPAFLRLVEFMRNRLLPAVREAGAAVIRNFGPTMREVAGVVKNQLLPALASLGRVFVDEILPAIKRASEFYGKHRTTINALAIVVGTFVLALKAWRLGIMAVAAVTKAFAAVQAALNAVMAMNPIGLVVIAIAALAAGLIYAYKNSETFRKIVDGAFSAIGKAASLMWDVLKPVFKLWLNTWFTIVGALVNGAASAFGWVPGIGGKLKAAATEFNKFRDKVNASLDGVTKDVKINIKANFTDARLGSASQLGPRQAMAGGGPVFAGNEYLVGENGPERIRMAAPGVVIPNHKLTAAGGDSSAVVDAIGRLERRVQEQTDRYQTLVRSGALAGAR